MSSNSGRISAAFGRHYEITLADGRCLTGFPPGKRSDFAVGDEVEIELQSADQCRILRQLPRLSLLYRSDAWKQKLIAANATQLVFVTATEPAFSDELLTRALVAAEEEHLCILIVLNKCDLAEKLDAARDALTPYRTLGYTVLELSARQDAVPLRAHLHQQRSVLVGQSGMGKSTLVKALLPEVDIATREISTALNSGKHTTTHARIYRLDAESEIIDCPGLQEFGLAHLAQSQVESAFPEMRPYLGQCRFRDCRHRDEPDCAIKNAVAAGHILPRRLALFQRIVTGID